MDFQTFKTRLALNIGNMQSSDPSYAYLGAFVNTATNQVILRATSKYKSLALFPELETYWTDVTALGVNNLDVPSDCLIVHEFRSFDDPDNPNLNTDRTFPVDWRDFSTFQTLDKASTVEGYPRTWTKRGNKIFIHPTPSANYLSYVMLVGVMKEPAMTAATDAPRCADIWHEAILDYASYLAAKARGWDSRMAIFLAACDQNISNVIDILGINKARYEDVVIQIAGDPTA